jgi:hypothetical protein
MSVECRKQIEGPAALVFMLIAAQNRHFQYLS